MNSTRVSIFMLLHLSLQILDTQEKFSVLNLINEVIIEADKLLLVYSNFEQDFINDILKHLKSVITININNEINLSSMEGTNFYLILLENITNFNKFLDRVHRIPGWNPRRKFLVFNVKNKELQEYIKVGCTYLLSNLVLVDDNFNIFKFAHSMRILTIVIKYRNLLLGLLQEN